MLIQTAETLPKLFNMRYTQFIIPLFTSDIIKYITWRDIVCQIVLEECKRKSPSLADTITLKSRLFTELHFSTKDICKIIFAVGKSLKIKFPYSLLMQQIKHFTVEDLATVLWKCMNRIVRNN